MQLADFRSSVLLRRRQLIDASHGWRADDLVVHRT